MPSPPPAPTDLSASEAPTGEFDLRAFQRGSPQPATSVPPTSGALGIRERRSWSTWQLVLVALGMLVLGMAVGNAFANKSPSPSSSGGSTAGTLPPPASTPSSGTAASASTSTTIAGSTSGALATTTTAPVTGTASVLVGPYQSKGNWTSPSFTIAGGQWSIGWAFQCSPVPVSGASLEIFVVPAGGNPGDTPAVSENGASGQSVTSQITVGSQELVVQAPAGCIWAVKVSGIG